MTRYVQCRGIASYHCPNLLGVSIGDSEAEVLKALGEPRVRRFQDTGSLRLEYGPENRWVVVTLEQDKVRGLAIGRPEAPMLIQGREPSPDK